MAAMFSAAELNGIENVRFVDGHVEVRCGCTTRWYGDNSGTLKLYNDGRVDIDCTCDRDCGLVQVTPKAFVKHSGRTSGTGNWMRQIWVLRSDGQKIKLNKTSLLRYYKHVTITEYCRPRKGLIVHRDEFIRCRRCQKQRRFLLRTPEECRVYHNAFHNQYWRCIDMSRNALTCDVPEERQSRLQCRGCPDKAKCEGCARCVCLGCDMCRFEDCGCRDCRDYIQNRDLEFHVEPENQQNPDIPDLNQNVEVEED